MLKYRDRGIIPGAPIQFQSFIQETHNVSSSHVSIYIGILPSPFLRPIRFSFAYFNHTKTILLGVNWTINLDIGYLGCLFSGVGESSFQAIAPPFIDQFTPESKRTLWLGIFYGAIAVGRVFFQLKSGLDNWMGLWIFYYSNCDGTNTFAYCKFIPDKFNAPLGQKNTKDIEEALLDIQNESICKSKSFWQETLDNLNHHFTSQQHLVMLGLVSFASAIKIGYGLLDDSIASTAFDGFLLVAGLAGSPLGGYVVDQLCRSNPKYK
ncbi:Major Facilitator Superfamily (MFS) [Thraustotheca clavata]|uniref:Major Facilitator Superfamily (MFS) n=1 Tax=Thraustotheca clavata TaxID=74557 RepID=A0A1V9ZAM2_9STRA|nr:Major Facilitator Superfamily (MFS) [Thraustotheca clavata]